MRSVREKQRYCNEKEIKGEIGLTYFYLRKGKFEF